MRWWPFGSRKLRPFVENDEQRAQISESLQRLTEDSNRRVETAKAGLDAAAADAVQAIDRRHSDTNYLREALKTLIDRKSHGRFDLSRGS